MVVGARLAGQKLLIYWDFATQTSLGFTENGLEKASYLVLFYVRGQMRMGRLFKADGKATATQTTTRCSHGVQKSSNTMNLEAAGLQQQ